MKEFAEILFDTLFILETIVVYPVIDIALNEALFFVPNLVIAFAFIWFIKKRKSRHFSYRTFRAAFLSTRIWWSKSSRIDYLSLFVNSICLASVTYIIARNFSGTATADSLAVTNMLVTAFGQIESPVNTFEAILLTSVTAFIVYDFFNYWYHRTLHEALYLWRIHSRHHSATNLTPFTNFRAHPLEAILRLPITYCASLLISGSCNYLLGGSASELLILGTNVFGFFILIFAGTLVHSHVFLCFPRWLSHIVVSPAMHQVHHSCLAQHRNKNYGSNLAIWDWFFDTLYLPANDEKVVFGLSQNNRCQGTFKSFLFTNSIKH